MTTLEPRPPEWVATAPVQIHQRVSIAAPPDAVWAELANNETWSEWFPGLKSCSFTSQPPHGVGSVRAVHLDQFRVSETITAWEPEKRWAMTVDTINLPVLAAMAEEALLTATDHGTDLDFTIGIELSGLGRLAKRPLVAKQNQALRTGLANLATRCADG